MDKNKLLNESKVFCMAPWVSVHAWPNGNIYPCCLWDSRKPLGNSNDTKFEEVLNNEIMRDTRLKMLNEQEVTECGRCNIVEKGGDTTPGYRKRLNRLFEDSFDVVESVGDPFQAFSMGLLIGARFANQPVILSGGSQMLAVIVLALEFLAVNNKNDFIEGVFIATTGWLLKDNSLNDLLNLINEKYNVNLLGLASPLNFKSSTYKELNDYELGHVKEGVGAGGISILAFLNGFKNKEIVSLCQQNLEMMKVVGQISLEKDR